MINSNITTTKQILAKFGEDIKKVRLLMDLTVNEFEFIELVGLMPNLDEILFGNKFVVKLLNQNIDFVLNLPKLRSINIRSRDNFELYTKGLQPNILEKVVICGYVIDDYLLEELFKRQTTIKRINLPSCYPSMAVMQALKLTHLCYHVQDSRANWDKKYNYLKDLLSCQPNLVSLNLMNYRDSMFALLPVDNEIMEMICNMNDLETLITNIDRVSEEAATHFSNLKKLKYLKIMSYVESRTLPVLHRITLLENLVIETFHSQIWYFEIPAQTYKQMGQNFKNLKHLQIGDSRVNKINLFLECFPRLESLNLNYTQRAKNFSDIYDLYLDGRNFPNVKILKIQIRSSEPVTDQDRIDNLKSVLSNVKIFNLGRLESH